MYSSYDIVSEKQYGVYYSMNFKKAAYLTCHRLHCFQVALK